MKTVKLAICIALGVVFGILLGFVLMKISQTVFMIASAALLAITAVYIVHKFTKHVALSKLIQIFAFVVSFVLWFCLLTTLALNTMVTETTVVGFVSYALCPCIVLIGICKR